MMEYSFGRIDFSREAKSRKGRGKIAQRKFFLPMRRLLLFGEHRLPRFYLLFCLNPGNEIFVTKEISKHVFLFDI